MPKPGKVSSELEPRLRTNGKAFLLNDNKQHDSTNAIAEVRHVGDTNQGDVAEAIFGGFLGFMMVLAISTIFLFGLTTTTAISSGAGAIGLTGLLVHVRPRAKR